MFRNKDTKCHKPHHPEKKPIACVLLIEGGGKAAIKMIVLSMTKNISYLIVNNGFLIDKLIKKHEKNFKLLIIGV